MSEVVGFGFCDLASARQIAKLLADGVRLSEIIRAVRIAAPNDMAFPLAVCGRV
jgi:hypothetical protein